MLGSDDPVHARVHWITHVTGHPWDKPFEDAWKTWDEAAHPRWPEGDSRGGQFRPKDGTGDPIDREDPERIRSGSLRILIAQNGGAVLNSTDDVETQIAILSHPDWTADLARMHARELFSCMYEDEWVDRIEDISPRVRKYFLTDELVEEVFLEYSSIQDIFSPEEIAFALASNNMDPLSLAETLSFNDEISAYKDVLLDSLGESIYRVVDPDSPSLRELHAG